jgi:Fe2+ or Zn2+ uptake regulation protein
MVGFDISPIMNARIHTHGHHGECDHETEIQNELRERGYRLTTPRLKIIEAISTAASPKTAKEIGMRTKIKDASTVYRTLAELVKEGLLAEFSDRGVAYFEVVHEHHDHAVCDSCGKVEHIPCVSDKKPRALTRAGWVIQSHDAIYRGLCTTCAVS